MNSSSSSSSENTTTTNGVLFVCLGNICRSPTAEAVLRHKIEQRDAVRSEKKPSIVVDSCGTGGGSGNWYKSGGFSYHEGEPPDARMTAAAAARKIQLRGASRPLVPGDFARFNYIVCMDNSNRDAILRALAFWRGSGVLSDTPEDVAQQESRLMMMADFIESDDITSVPDPYYGGSKGFELVLDLLENASDKLLDYIEQQRS